MDDKIKKLKEWVAESDNIVFFGGAGVSTESGIPDFRSVDGLYNQQWKYPPETILSHSFFIKDPEEYYRFHRAKLVVEGVKPNRVHLRLAELEREGKLRAVITQNIDGLQCRKPYPADVINYGSGVPRCSCGGVIRPDIVLYEEGLDQDILYRSVEYIRNADMMIVGGTSLNVYPAAGLINYYRGNKLVLVNRSATSYDSYADLVIHDTLGEVFDQI